MKWKGLEGSCHVLLSVTVQESWKEWEKQAKVMVRIACDPAEIQTRWLCNTSPVLLLHKEILIWNKVNSYCTYN
jgi:hypothetical protein